VAVQRVEEFTGADRRITIDSVATALGCSHSLAYRIMHDYLKFRKVCAQSVPRELKDQEKN
jgi:predicted DNA-binding transcriptional regulator AlpA